MTKKTNNKKTDNKKADNKKAETVTFNGVELKAFDKSVSYANRPYVSLREVDVDGLKTWFIMKNHKTIDNALKYKNRYNFETTIVRIHDIPSYLITGAVVTGIHKFNKLNSIEADKVRTNVVDVVDNKLEALEKQMAELKRVRAERAKSL